MGRRITERPWQIVANNIMGPLPRTKHGHEYILIKGLNERVCLRFGVPEVFLSDDETEFKNAPLKAFLKEKSVHHTFTPPYHTQANPVERVNRTVKTMIMSYAEENHRSWDDKLNELAFAYNTAEHSSTKRSPAMLMYGR